MAQTVHKPPEEFQPKIVIIINGKRKSGKDYFTNMLVNRLGKEDTAVMHIANPIKHYWAVKNNLDYEKLLDTSSYKEDHRFKMVAWSQEVRKDNYGYFNVEAIKMSQAVGKPIWICSDVRHKEDYKWFFDFYPSKLKTVKVVATPEIRVARGWVYTPGVDDGPSECDLDYLDKVSDWDLIVQNNNEDSKNLEEAVTTILGWLSSLPS